MEQSRPFTNGRRGFLIVGGGSKGLGAEVVMRIRHITAVSLVLALESTLHIGA
jgi:hypothetical protein